MGDEEIKTSAESNFEEISASFGGEILPDAEYDSMGEPDEEVAYEDIIDNDNVTGKK